jgi:plasmid stability protein
MPDIQIRDLPHEVITALERRTIRRGRSLEGEIRELLVKLAQEEPPAPPLPPIELKLSQASPETAWRRDEIYGDDGR